MCARVSVSLFAGVSADIDQVDQCTVSQTLTASHQAYPHTHSHTLADIPYTACMFRPVLYGNDKYCYYHIGRRLISSRRYSS